MLEEYLALRRKIDGFVEAVGARRAADLQCRRGCAGCCQVALTLCPVEAAALTGHLRGRAEPVHAGAPGPPGACVMLRGDGACAVYEARPLVCRTQGLPLRYPPGLIPAAALLGRGGGGDVTWCPLNFTEVAARPLRGDDVLDAARVDELLALVNQRYAARAGVDPLARVALEEIAQRPLSAAPGCAGSRAAAPRP